MNHEHFHAEHRATIASALETRRTIRALRRSASAATTEPEARKYRAEADVQHLWHRYNANTRRHQHLAAAFLNKTPYARCEPTRTRAQSPDTELLAFFLTRGTTSGRTPELEAELEAWLEGPAPEPATPTQEAAPCT